MWRYLKGQNRFLRVVVTIRVVITMHEGSREHEVPIPRWYAKGLDYCSHRVHCKKQTRQIGHNNHYKNLERHTADTIVSWPNPKQWVIVHTSDLTMIIRQSIYIYIFSQSSQGEWVNWKHTAPHIVQWITERICLILLTHSTKISDRHFII